jgi:sugar lactone lactonase YvrE
LQPGFLGGLRAVDFTDPFDPREVGYFIADPGAGRKTVQTNDVDVDDRGLIYVLDRFQGLDIVEFTG